MELSYEDLRTMLSLLKQINSKLCQASIGPTHLIQDVDAPPTWNPNNDDEDQAVFAFDRVNGIFYYWDGNSWEVH